MEPLLYVLLGCLLTFGGFFLKWRLLGFSAQKPSDYADGTEILDLRRHLRGEILCDGVIFGPTGRVTSRFEGRFNVRWDGDVAQLSERFQYDSGEAEERVWQLTLGEDGQITATAADVLGIGRGQLSGPTLQLQYRIKLAERAGGHVLSAIDWMYLAPNGTIVNRSQFRKYGIKVAELVATMRRKEDT